MVSFSELGNPEGYLRRWIINAAVYIDTKVLPVFSELFVSVQAKLRYSVAPTLVSGGLTVIAAFDVEDG